MFLGQFSDGGDFRDSGIEGINRFMNRVWKLFTENEAKNEETTTDELFQMHKTIKKVSEDIKRFSYNTSIAALMEWYNYLSLKLKNNGELKLEEVKVYLKLLAPFAPFMTEELWQNLGFTGSEFEKAGPAAPHPHLQSSDALRAEAGGPPVASPAFASIHFQKWPEFDEKYLSSDEVTIVVQINGKRRGEIKVASSEIKVQSEVENKAKEDTAKHLEGKEIKKVIYISGKIINFVL
jgi:leucyl-tRNA synthetase